MTDLPSHPGHFIVETRLRNYETFPPFVIRREGSEVELRDDIDPPVPDEPMDANDRGLLQLLGAESLTSNELRSLAEAHNIPRSTFYRVLRLLQRNGRIYHDALSRRWVAIRPPRLNVNTPAQPVYNHDDRPIYMSDTFGNVGTNGTNGTQPAGETNEMFGTRDTGSASDPGNAVGIPGTEGTPPPI